MNPIELIKKGIETEDWTKICKAYKALTGLAIEPKTETDCSLSSVIKDRLDDSEFKLLLELAYKLLFTTTESPVTTIEKKTRRRKPKVAIEKPHSGFNTIPTTEDGFSSRNHTTKFSSAEEEQEFNRKKAEGTRAKKNEVRRKRPKKHLVECSGCSNKFESKIPSGEIGQRCPKCLKSLPRTRA